MGNDLCPKCGGGAGTVKLSDGLSRCAGCGTSFARKGADRATLCGGARGGEVVGEAPLPPGFLDRYELGTVLGSGMMGTVYEAQDRVTGARVAIKFLLERRDENARTRFLQEGRLMAELRHPHLVPVLDLGTAGEHPYIVCEFMPGGTLAALMATGETKKPERAIPLVLDVLAALQMCHARLVIHRDIKPANVLIDGEGKARLADLGIAKDYRSEDAKMTAHGGVLGTPLYMAPEQLAGEATAVASDLFAVGVILYEMLAGEPPFKGESLVELIANRQDGPPPPLSTVVPDLPPRLAAVVAKAIEERPEKRHSSADAFALELRRCQKVSRPASAPGVTMPSGKPVRPPSPVPTTELALTVQPGPRSVPVPLVLSMLLAALAGGAIVHHGRRGAEKPAPAAARPESKPESRGEHRRGWVRRESGDEAPAEGLDRLRARAETGDAMAQLELGRAYELGRGVRADPNLAATYYTRAAEQNNEDAKARLGHMIASGATSGVDPERTMGWMRAAAEKGVADAQSTLGQAYEYGRGVTQDYTQALGWLKKAAEQGDASAMTELGVMYEHGWGVPRDEKQAYGYYRSGAEHGNTTAQVDLGACYENGTGTPKDAAQAVAWYQKAADKGDASGQAALGIAYLEGSGVEKDPAKAADLLRKAADAEDARGQAAYGYLFEEGIGVEKDASRAFHWYQVSAEAGDAQGQRYLAAAYENGTGTEVDVKHAIQWYEKAAAQDDEEAKQALQRLNGAEARH